MSSDVVNSPDDTHDQGLKSKKLSRGKLRRMDSLDMESGTVHGHSHHGSKVCTPHPFMHGNWEKENLIYIYIFFNLLNFCFEGYQGLVCDTAPGVSEHGNSVWGHWNFAVVRVCKHFH